MGGRKPRAADFVPAPDREAFERQPGETNRAWRAFQFYRDLGFERSIRKAAGQYRGVYGGKGAPESVERILEGWSAKYGWKVRGEEWDRFLDKQNRKKAIKENEEMRKRHAQIGKSLQELGALGLKKHLDEARAGKGNLNPAELVRVFDQGVKLERTSRGEPEAIIEERHRLSSDETRDALRPLLDDPEANRLIDELLKRTNEQGAKKKN
ncbi:MAG: hypothetical protein GWM98_04800 [Nitrospinaceae bacterium]|nr:hypothetical protein [Deltaproteobacteria bacterium]NIY14239.1 hypothetical protein [Nitrospinaceae bacterium]